jgi:flagellar biosynthesis protein FlhA
MGGTLVDRISSLRKQIAQELGIVVPPIHIRDNLQLAPGRYRFVLLGTEIAGGDIRAGKLLAMDPSGTAPTIDGEETVDPTFGTPARWISSKDREIAEALGYTVVEHATIMATHLAEVVRKHAYQILGRGELQALFDVFSRNTPKLVEDLIPSLLSFGEVLKVMRNLLREGVSIRDLRTLLEALFEIAPTTRDPEQLTELVRQRLYRQITSSYTGRDGSVAALILDPQVEDMFRRSLQEIAQGVGGALDPSKARQLGDSLEYAVSRMQYQGLPPCLVTSPDLRRYVRAFAERRCPMLGVLSFREIDPTVTIRPVETVSFVHAAAA